MRLNPEDSEALAYKLHVACFSGGSSRGMSYWADASKCGMRALLNERAKSERSADPLALPPLHDESKEKKSAFSVGSSYHKLHELHREGSLKLADGELLQVDPTHYSASHLEALRLFNGWMAHWKSDLWGQTHAVEQEVVVTVGGYPVSAMPDLVTKIEWGDPLAQARKRCPQIPSPGLYLIDFKTSDQPYEDMYYKSGLQALWYCHAWNKANPDLKVNGIIFDTIYKFGRRKDKSITSENFGAVYVDANQADEVPLLGMLQQGYQNIQRAKREGRGNRSECHKFSFSGTETCKFYANGCTNEIAEQ